MCQKYRNIVSSFGPNIPSKCHQPNSARVYINLSNMFIPEKIISLDDAERVRTEFDHKDYPKLASIVRLREVGLPILPGFIIKEVTPEILDFASSWIAETSAKRLSFRFDSPNPVDHKRLTLSNPTLEEFKEMAPLIAAPVIGLILAENDRFCQRHSVLTRFEKDCVRCEVVGPGFDAADLTRGRVSPHETFVIQRTDDDFGHIDIEEHRVVDEEVYKQSRVLRYCVIAAILKKGIGKSGSIRNLGPDGSDSVDKFIESRGACIPDTYEPLSFETLRYLYEYLHPLNVFRDYFRRRFNLEVDNHVLSASFLKKHGLVFWDLYGPNKYHLK